MTSSTALLSAVILCMVHLLWYRSMAMSTVLAWPRKELVYVNDMGPVSIQKLEQIPCLVDGDLHGRKVSLQRRILESVLKLRKGDLPGVFAVYVPEKAFEGPGILLLRKQVLLHHHVLVVICALNRCLAEDASHHVE
eukprot:CAMPEP_0175628170 /NCGR_PEP_ID=MMETSP0096-20121207/71866_1 /TAXON_ID=311494 /ORGANISM="Alexandrium monilatum, Strain CCMP3105" /LENGTH=136 /DNA_ID=CAMNT_0016933569 /DNA_START=169 /DNA_END=576 /DNA_ORIENTATION=+